MALAFQVYAPHSPQFCCWWTKLPAISLKYLRAVVGTKLYHIPTHSEVILI